MSGVEEKWMSDLDSTGSLYVKFAYPIIKYMKFLNFKFRLKKEEYVGSYISIRIFFFIMEYSTYK